MAAIAVTVAIVALLVAGGEEGSAKKKKKNRLPDQPNVVLIMTDDQSLSSYHRGVMPKLFRKVVDQGTSFNDYIVTTPLCCPSRATTITGQYGHNNGVLRNDYALLKGKRNTLPVWLQQAGYTTAHVGKYMNEYEDFARDPEEVAPGWDKWFTQLERRKFYNWKASKNGKVKRFGARNKDHLTDVTSRQASRWTRKMARADDPFYLQLDYYAPHVARGRARACGGGPVPSPVDVGRYQDAPLPKPPSYNEADVSDKPNSIRTRPSITPEQEEVITRRYRCVVEALRGVDRGFGKVYRQVKKAGELDRTVFIFTSDNGYYFGEHRIPKGKTPPYDENLHMPLAIRVPPAYRDQAPIQRLSEDPTANIDLAPTITDLAHAEPCNANRRCRTMDGRSLLPIIDGTGSVPADRAFAVELASCFYRAVRKEDNIYFEYGRGPIPTTGECAPTEFEHYDLNEDPYQLENRYPAPRRSEDGRIQRELGRELDNVRRCAGIQGRDPRPPSGIFCR